MSPEWLNDFPAFLKYMGKCPPGFELDRYPDQDGNYEPGNCRWTTRKEQTRNQRNNRFLTIDGETLTVAEWVERSGLDTMTVRGRLAKGWPPKDAVFKPLLHPNYHLAP